MADLGAYRDGVLFYAALCEVRTRRWRGHMCAIGLFVALVYVGAHLITFAVQPITNKILWGWNVGALVQFAVAGAIIGVIYKPGLPTTTRV